MNDATGENVAKSLETLADQREWNLQVWQGCYELVKANGEDQIVGYVYDDVIHYSGLFNARNILCVRVRVDRVRLEEYQREFREVASALRSRLSLIEARKLYSW